MGGGGDSVGRSVDSWASNRWGPLDLITRPPCIPARDFYGPEGVYGGFAGHDVTKAFALNSLEEKDLDVAE